jgi:hypothetical protein
MKIEISGENKILYFISKFLMKNDKISEVKETHSKWLLSPKVYFNKISQDKF